MADNSSAIPDLLGGSSGPTMVNMPPSNHYDNGNGNGDGNGGGGASSSDNIAAALSSVPTATAPPPAPGSGNSWKNWGGLVTSARDVVSKTVISKQQSGGGEDGNNKSNDTTTINSNGKIASPPSSGNAFSFSTLTSNITTSVSNLNTPKMGAPGGSSSGGGVGGSFAPLQSSLQGGLQSLTKSISNNLTGKNTLPDKTTASQVLMFRQLLHTKCRPGLRLSRRYEGTPAQMAVLHMPWWERGIEQTKKMVISYDNLITRLWLSGAIMPFEKGGYASSSGAATGGDGNNPSATTSSGAIDTLINEKGLPPVPHSYWVDRLGFQQDDPVTDFRSGGVLSLAMLVHIVESCPTVHSRFVPKPKPDATLTSPYISTDILSLEELITDDASVLPFGITCINITDMLAKFLLFSKAVDKMDALLSAKPFWKMFIDPNAMLVLQEVSLDLLCDVCVEIGRERRIRKLVAKAEGAGGEEGKKESVGMPGTQDGKVTVFDFSEIMERTEKRVGDEVLGAGPQNVDELRAIARRVKSKYLMRIQLKEKHSLNNNPTSPLSKQIPPMPSKESMKNVTNSVIGGMGGFVSMLKSPASRGGGVDKGATPTTSDNEQSVRSADAKDGSKDGAPETPGGQEVEVHLDGTTSSPAEDNPLASPKSPVNPFASTASPNANAVSADNEVEVDELEKLSAELGELSAVTEAFDLLGDDFNITPGGIEDHPEDLLDAMDVKVDPMAAFAIDDDEFLS